MLNGVVYERLVEKYQDMRLDVNSMVSSAFMTSPVTILWLECETYRLRQMKQTYAMFSKTTGPFTWHSPASGEEVPLLGSWRACFC